MPVSVYDDRIKKDVGAIATTLESYFQCCNDPLNEPSWEDLYPDETYLYLDVTGYGSDPQFPNSPVHRILNMSMLLRSGYDSDRNALLGKAAMMLNIENALPFLKRDLPESSILWDVVPVGEIYGVTSVLLRSQPRTWIVEASLDFMARIVVLKNSDGTHRLLL